MCFLQLVGKRYPLKAVRTLKKKKKKVEEEENYSLRTEHTLEHKALSGTDSILCARCKSILWEAPEKGAYHQSVSPAHQKACVVRSSSLPLQARFHYLSL